MSITDVQLSVLENLLNRALRTDPDMRDRLQKVAGKRIALHSYIVTDLDICVEILAGEIRLSRDLSNADASIEAGPSSLIYAGLKAEDRRPFSDGRITVNGDTRLVHYLSELVQKFDPDWQELLSARIGDTFTWKIEQLIKKATIINSRLAEKVRLDSGEYLREEARILAGDVAVNRFTDGVDNLIEDFERLNQRIKKIEKRISCIEVD